jgi:hypothetical protein
VKAFAFIIHRGAVVLLAVLVAVCDSPSVLGAQENLSAPVGAHCISCYHVMFNSQWEMKIASITHHDTCPEKPAQSIHARMNGPAMFIFVFFMIFRTFV